MAVVVLGCALLLVEQRKLAIEGADLAIRAQNETSLTSQMRDTLVDMNGRARLGEVPEVQMAQFRDLLERAQAIQLSDEGNRFNDLRRRFDAYSAILRRNKNVPITGAWSEVSSALESVIRDSRSSIYYRAERLRADQKRYFRTALLLLSSFIFFLVGTGLKVIEIIIRPLTTLVHFLDEIRVEEDLPPSIPDFDNEIPEVQHVARSFRQVMNRLRGYRALNVRRLLNEKRRADIIAASISDGVFLLRQSEMLYLNPVGERLMGLQLNGKTLPLDRLNDNRAARAILQAIGKSLPVEFSVEDSEQRKSHYLIQSYSLPSGLLEQVEQTVVAPIEQALESVLDCFQPDTIVIAQDMTLLRESQEAKGHFLGTLSHEVKTPVTSLTMATRLLKRQIDLVPNPTHRSLILTCADDVERLRGLLEDLLKVTRFDTLTQRLTMQTIDLGKLVRHTAQTFQLEARERGVSLMCHLGANAKQVLVPVDATKVSWALSNLLVNALRHTPSGGQVDVYFDVVDDKAEVRVKDTGTGIDRKRQGRIFEKFNPFYDLRVARSGSAGMGLAIAREIITAHGGKIWVTSEPGRGAEFCFTVPLKQTSESEKNNASTSSPAGLTRGSANEIPKGAGQGARTNES